MRLLWLCLLGIVLPAAGLAETLAPETAPAQDISDDDRRLVEQLDAPNYLARTEAARRLRQLGPAAIPALEVAASRGRSNILPPALDLLERMLIEDSPDIADAAERALERLAFSEQPAVMQRARAVLTGNQHIRTRRALAAIRELGGRIVFEPLDGALRNNPFWGLGGDTDGGIPGTPLATIHIWLLRGWQGGDEGLWHMARLEDTWSARIWQIEITNVRGSGVSMEAVQSLAARVPHLVVDERGASLGIKGGPTGQISEVVPGGAAAKAGVQELDFVRALDGVEINSFTDMISRLLEYEPDQQAVLTVNRNGEDLDLPVTLGGWDNLNVVDPSLGPFQLPDRRPPPLLPNQGTLENLPQRLPEPGRQPN